MRIAEIERKTRETSVFVQLNLDGSGKCDLDIPAGFIKHMLEIFAKHSFIDLKINAKGDTEVDYHHLVEDLGICLGQALDKALANREKINRYGWAAVPMDEALTLCAVDICNRPVLKYDVKLNNDKVGDFDVQLIKEFFKAFSDNARITLHFVNFYGINNHHIIESVFKACSQAVKLAVEENDRIKGVLSTKDVI